MKTRLKEVMRKAFRQTKEEKAKGRENRARLSLVRRSDRTRSRNAAAQNIHKSLEEPFFRKCKPNEILRSLPSKTFSAKMQEALGDRSYSPCFEQAVVLYGHQGSLLL